MLPLAPGLLSTITLCPASCLPKSGAIMRATVSRIPPGATGTTSVIGFAGKGACAAANTDAQVATQASAKVRMPGMGVLLWHPWYWELWPRLALAFESIFQPRERGHHGRSAERAGHPDDEGNRPRAVV